MTKRIGIFFLLFVMLCSCLPAGMAEEEHVSFDGSKLALSTPDLKVNLVVEDGISVTYVQYFDEVLFDEAAKGFKGKEPLVRVDYGFPPDDEIHTVDSKTGWSDVQVTAGAESVSILLGGCEELPGVVISVDAKLDQEKSAIVWISSVVSCGDSLSIREVSYPRLPMQIKGKKQIFYAKGPGNLYRVSDKSILYETQDESMYGGYPSWNNSMSYMALLDEKTNKGLYCGLHDPRPSYKKLYFTVQRKKNSWLECAYPAEGFGEMGNTFSLAGREVWQAFEGNWYEAALIYRDFVNAEATWLPERDENGFLKNKSWAVRMPHWWKSYAISPKTGDNLVKAQEDLGVPSGLHLYAWFDHSFDNDYPHYFPYKAFVPELIAKVQAAGIKVAPYVNGWLWDTRDKDMEDYQYSAIAKPATVKRINGNPLDRAYGREKNGERAILSRMCPTTDVWHKTLKELVIQVEKELGVDGIYLDQIASGSPRFCFDANHDHRVGGGSWWVESYQEIMAEIREAMPDDFCMVSESVSEPYLKELDMMLGWTNMYPYQVPAFAAVYGGATTFGRCYNSIQEPTKNDELFEPGDYLDRGVRMISAQSLVFGEALGWIRPELYLSMGCRDFYRQLAQIRYQYTDFFVDGEMLKPPFVPMGYDVEVKLGMVGGFKLFNEKPILTALWKNRHTGETLLLIINITDQPQTTVLQSEYFEGGTREVNLAPEQIIVEVIPAEQP